MNFVNKILFISLFILSFACKAGTVLSFKSEIKTTAHKLGDVLQIEPDTQSWGAISLDSTPLSGECLSKDSILDWMTQHLGHFNATWRGAKLRCVMRVTLASEKSLINKAYTKLRQQLRANYLHVTLTPISHPHVEDMSLDDFKTEVTLEFPTRARVCVWLINKHNKNIRVPVWFNVAAYTKVLVANRDIRYNKDLLQEDFSWQQRNIAGMREVPVLTWPSGHKLTSSMKSGAILNEHQLQESPLIIHGKRVHVAVRNHNITVYIDAIARSDGYLGDKIQVKNPLNQKIFEATVRGIEYAEMSL